MKGMLVKDLISIKKMFIACLIIAILMTLLGIMAPMFVVVGTGYLSYIFYSAIANDEASHWNMLAAALPVERKEYVSSKYIIMFGMTLIMTVIMALVSGIGAILNGLTELNMFNTWKLIPINVSVDLFLPTILLPVWVRFGYGKSGIFLVAMAFPIIIIMPRICTAERFVDVTFSFLSAAPILFMLGSVFAFAVSWVISVKLSYKRDY